MTTILARATSTTDQLKDRAAAALARVVVMVEVSFG